LAGHQKSNSRHERKIKAVDLDLVRMVEHPAAQVYVFATFENTPPDRASAN